MYIGITRTSSPLFAPLVSDYCGNSGDFFPRLCTGTAQHLPIQDLIRDVFIYTVSVV